MKLTINPNRKELPTETFNHDFGPKAAVKNDINMSNNPNIAIVNFLNSGKRNINCHTIKPR